MISTPKDRSTASDPAGSEPQERSIGEIVASIRDELTSIVRHEIEIAKAEVKATLIKAGIGAIGFGIAAFLLLNALILLFFAAAWGLGAAGLPMWASFLIVAGALIVIAVIAALIGLNRIKAIRAPEQTIATAQGTVSALKGDREPAVDYDDVYSDLYHREVPGN